MPVKEPAKSEVQIGIRSVGICGSDVTYWQKGAIGDLVVTSPMVMGHEPSGVVTKVGESVQRLAVGDRVAIEPNNPCGFCQMCKTGHYNLCDHLKYLASPPTHGCMQRVYCHPANFVYKLPDNVSFDEGALVQPLALGFYAAERAGVKVGDYVLVSGAGPLGMSVVLASKACGAAKILVTDVLQDRLDYIAKIGADVTVLARSDDTGESISRRCVAAMGGSHVDAAIECSGQPVGTANAIHSARKRGVVVQVGFGTPSVEVPLVTATLKELDIRGMTRFANNAKKRGTVVQAGFGGPSSKVPLVTATLKELTIRGMAGLYNTYPTVLEALATGRVNAKQLVTHRFPLEKAIEALAAARNREGVKIIIDCSREEDK